MRQRFQTNPYVSAGQAESEVVEAELLQSRNFLINCETVNFEKVFFAELNASLADEVCNLLKIILLVSKLTSTKGKSWSLYDGLRAAWKYSDLRCNFSLLMFKTYTLLKSTLTVASSSNGWRLSSCFMFVLSPILLLIVLKIIN